MTKLAPLGSPPRFELRRVERPTFLVRFEYDGIERNYNLAADEATFDPQRREQVKSFFSELAAYRWLARRMIFVRRDRFQREPFHLSAKADAENCTLCHITSTYDGEVTGFCRYHESRSFRRLEARLARWLRWRDRRRAGT